MNEVDSVELMNQLLEYATVSENVIEHIWEEGDLILNNNYNTVHQREKFYSIEERTLWRTTFQIPELIPLSIKPDTF
jgi:alpha-ketoglutarate-dependent taurine dioxygenase